MDLKHKLILAAGVAVVFCFIWVIIFGDNGFIDFYRLHKEKDMLIQKNEKIMLENQTLYKEIDRLRYDLKFVESVARKDLGMIGENEIIFRFKDKEVSDGETKK